jgi:hypothetical protein
MPSGKFAAADGKRVVRRMMFYRNGPDNVGFLVIDG